MFSFISGGNSSNKKQTKEEKVVIQQAKQEKIEERIQQVENIERVIYDNVVTDSSKISLDEFKNIMMGTETAKNQLQRGSAPLNKTDLAMVVFALDQTQDLTMLQKLTISDLNALIRTIIYCPKVSKKNDQSMLTNNQTLNNNSLVMSNSTALTIPEKKKVSNNNSKKTMKSEEQLIKSSKNPFSSV